MKKLLPLFVFLSISLGAFAQNGGDLFISEYLEGSQNNQALEIFNPGTQSVDLSNYRICYSIDGGDWSIWKSFPAGKTLPAKTVWTIVNDQFTVPSYNTSLADEKVFSSDLPFRGNDAVGLMKISPTDTILIDVIGATNLTTAISWDVAGIFSATQNHTLIRKSSVEQGNTDWDLSRGSNEINSEWIVKDIDFADSLGHHTYAPLVAVTDIILSLAGSDTIKTNLGNLQILAEVLPANASNKKLSWSSSQPLVASVNQSGFVQAFNDGATWIKVIALDGSGVTDSIKITTINQDGTLPVSSITVSGLDGKDTISTNQGSLQMVASIKPGNATIQIVTWSVDNSNIADISIDGILTARKNGKVKVTAVSTDGSAVSGEKTVIIINQFSEVSNLKQLRAAFNGDETVYKINGEVFLSHAIFNRNIKYVQDAGAGIEIDDPSGKITSQYNVGDGFKDLTGYMEEYYGMLLFHPIEDPGPSSSQNNLLSPILLSVQEFNDNFENYEARLIRINHLEFDLAKSVFVELENYTVRNGADITVVRSEFVNADYIGLAVPDSADVTGLAIQFNTTGKIAPRNFKDLTYLPVWKTGIDNAGYEKLICYPNPATDVLQIKTSDKISYLSIYSIDGTLINTLRINNNTYSLNISRLPRGLYLLSLTLNEKTEMIKFTKE